MMEKRQRTAIWCIAFVFSGMVLVLFFVWPPSGKHEQSNVMWRINGVCVNAINRKPVAGATVSGEFKEPIKFKHYSRNPVPVRTTQVLTKTDADGRFEVSGEGGSASVTVEAEGYCEPDECEPWFHRAINRVNLVETNLLFLLNPSTKPTRSKGR